MVKLDTPQTFDRIMLQEPIRFGQRIKAFSISGYINDQWKTLAAETTVGYKRLLRIQEVTTDKVQTSKEDL